MTSIIPHLWFADQAEEAAHFYVSVFSSGGRPSKVGKAFRYSEAAARMSGREKGSVMTISFTLDGQEFLALNGGPVFTFNESISFMVQCRTQKEVDHFWDHLSEGGDSNAQQCGWLKDKFGLSWQIVPVGLNEMLESRDPKKAERVTETLLGMKKLDIDKLQEAFEGK
jgi:predicted 3-demethylubiquinone-9 3-methyltransferase (glyoxalase superfamily)